MASADRAVDLLAVLAVLAVGVVVLGALFGSAPLVTAGLVAFFLEYALYLLTADAALDGSAAVLAALTLVAAEAAFGAAEPPVRVRSRRLRARWAAAIAATALGALVLAAFVLAAAGAEIATGLAVELLGVGAAVGALGLVAYLARAARAGG